MATHVDTLLTADEVAGQLRRSRHWVNLMAQRGEIGGEKVGRYWRFTQADIDTYRARVRNHPSDPMARSTASARRRRRSP